MIMTEGKECFVAALYERMKIRHLPAANATEAIRNQLSLRSLDSRLPFSDILQNLGQGYRLGDWMT